MDQGNESEQNLHEKFLRSEKIIPGSDGWLSPSGVFFKAGSTEHDESADWIIKNNFSELPRKYRRTPKSDSDIWESSDLSQRQFLYKNRWILINGPIFRTEDALNYTVSQLKLLLEAGIPVVGAFDGSKEFSSQETLEWVEKAVKNISDFMDKQVLKISKSAWERAAVNQDEFWKDVSNRGYSTIEDFKKDPFHTRFGDFGSVSFTDVRDILTEGYHDEMIFDCDRETYTFRLVRLNSGENICVEYTFHHHDRDSGNEEHMNTYVVDDFTFKQKINRFISFGIEPRIEGEYFKRLTKDK